MRGNYLMVMFYYFKVFFYLMYKNIKLIYKVQYIHKNKPIAAVCEYKKHEIYKYTKINNKYFVD